MSHRPDPAAKNHQTVEDMAKILIINGPNLNLLGTREPDIYGNQTMATALERVRAACADDEIDYFQSNHEGDIIDRLQQAGADPTVKGVALNAGAYTHTSLAIHDAIASIATPVVEVHISNVHAREAVRHQSLIASACRGVVAGFGLDSYRLAVDALLHLD